VSRNALTALGIALLAAAVFAPLAT